MNKLKILRLFSILLLFLLSCTIATKDLAINSSRIESLFYANIIIDTAEDFRPEDNFDREHFPHPAPAFERTLESELMRFNVNVITRSELDSLFQEKNLQLSGATEDILELGRLEHADFILTYKIHAYSWTETAFSIQIIDVETGKIFVSASYTDHEKFLVPVFLSDYNPSRQMRQDVSDIFSELEAKMKNNTSTENNNTGPEEPSL